MTKFSVVVPLYNKRPHIARAIDSILAQTLPADEIIVVDDGSVDGSYEYVEGLGDPRIKLHRRNLPGPGGYAARNLGIELASAAWIAFLDADDEWLPNHLETLDRTMRIADRPQELVCIGSGYRNVFPGGEAHDDIYTRYRAGAGAELLDFTGMLKTWLAVGGSPIWTSATACRRDALISAGLFPADRCRRGGDKDMWLRVATVGLTAINPTVSAIYYKDSVNMVTNRKSVNERHCMCETIEAMLPLTPAIITNLLRKVYNLEVYKYCIRTVKTTRLDRTAWKGFHASVNPARFLVLAALSNGLAELVLRLTLRFHPKVQKRRRQATAGTKAA